MLAGRVQGWRETGSKHYADHPLGSCWDAEIVDRLVGSIDARMRNDLKYGR